MMKQLSPSDNLDFKTDVQQILHRKLFAAQSNIWEMGHHYVIPIPSSHSSASTSTTFNDNIFKATENLHIY
jgi:hypothetical protein